MATINGMYIFVTGEEMDFGVEVTEHPVESGVAISDHVKRKGITLSLKGEIVGKNANNIRAQLMKLHQNGGVCKYSGRTTLNNCLIASFSTSHPNTIWGGCEFAITLKEIRTAAASYAATTTTTKKTKSTKKSGTQQKTPKSKETYVYHTVKKGDCVWNLVASSKGPYKSLKRPAIKGKNYNACNWVMAMNQSAFSRKGDFGTLKIGKKIIVGMR